MERSQSARPPAARAPLAVTEQPLGQRLLDAGLITSAQLDEALRLQRRDGLRLGETLIGMGAVRGDLLARALAAQHDLAAYDPWQCLPDAAALALDADDWYRDHRVIPLSRDAGTLHVATADPADPALLDALRRRTGLAVVPVAASERDIERALHRRHLREDLRRSTRLLLSDAPEDSAHRVLTRRQQGGAAALLALLALLLALDALLTLSLLVSAMTALHIVASLYRLYLVQRGWDWRLDEAPSEQAILEESELPIYTLLVPLYREAAILTQLTDAIRALDWPKGKLDVRLLLEEDDTATIAAAHAARLPAYFTFVIVPPGGPQGKPKACNYGLLHARGAYVVIYDAEDIPEPDQLRKVYARFRLADTTLACVQCRLNFYNPGQNILTRWFTAEYSMWFDFLLPGLQRLRAPIPLGGTSNHFRRSVLHELRAWDPYNVTEDADLGIRLFKRGYRTAILDSTTYEEANPRLGNWLRQRSRWIKGYIVTWAVHMRHPLALWRQLGPRGFVHFQLMIGGNGYVLLLNPIYWLLTILWFATNANVLTRLFPGPIYLLAVLALLIGNFVFIYTAMIGAFDRGRYGLVRYALLSPLYWIVMSAAAWKGFLQLFYAPAYWEKTAHGLADRRPSAGSRAGSHAEAGPLDAR